MRQRRKSLIVVAIMATLALVVSVAFVLAQPSSASAGGGPHVTGAAQSATITNVSHHTANMASARKATAAQLRQGAERELHAHPRLSAQAYARVKSLAKRSAPRSNSSQQAPHASLQSTFSGVQSSASVCPPNGCNPPDMGLATSPHWVFQGVNTSFAVFDTHGNLQAGWPKFFGDFFGIPDPGACAGNIPFTSDPRPLYDPNDDRFFAAALEVEGAFGVNGCPFTTLYWIAVSQTNNPNGAWN